jgi:hypothetical protein
MSTPVILDNEIVFQWYGTPPLLFHWFIWNGKVFEVSERKFCKDGFKLVIKLKR